MKKSSLFILLISVIGFTPIFGQSDSGAKKLLTELAEKYGEFTSLEASFEMEIDIPDQDIEVQSGHFKQQGEQFLMQSAMQDVYSDGTDIWIHLKDNNEVQINSVEDGEENMSSLSPKGIIDKYNSDQYISAITDKSKGKISVEFKPQDNDDEMSKARMVINNKTKEIEGINIFNKDGTRYSIKILNIVPNKTIDSNVFVFNKEKYPNVYIEDLRID